MFLRLVVSCVLTLFAGFLGPALGAERRIALVIGNSSYAAISPLPNPRNDAELMARTLESIGFEVIKVVDADQATMKSAMVDFGRKLRAGVDASLFFYAGHGVQAHGENYLIPVDAAITDEGELDLQAVDVNAFLRVMEGSSSNVNIVILDACRNNPFAGRFRSASRGLAMVDAPRGTYIAYSTAPGQVAEDGNGANSTYTAALAGAITIPGIRIEDAFKSARRNVIEATVNQVPWETSSITGDFYFLPTDASVAAPTTPSSAVVSDDTVFWNSILASDDPKDFEAYLERFPKGTFSRLAQNRLAALDARSDPAPIAPPQPTGIATTIHECDRLAGRAANLANPPGVKGVSTDAIVPRAIDVCRAAVEQYPDVSRFAFNLSRAYLARKRYDEALALMQKSAKAGDPASIGTLGFYYDAGVGVRRNIGTAIRYYREGAEAGDPRAMSNYGAALQDGEGELRVDIAAARSWFEKAAARGDPNGQYMLANLLMDGRGGPKDLDRGVDLFVTALASGDASLINKMLGEPQSSFPAPARKALQQHLIDKGYLDGAADGVLGPATRTALERLKIDAATGG